MGFATPPVPAALRSGHPAFLCSEQRVGQTQSFLILRVQLSRMQFNASESHGPPWSSVLPLRCRGLRQAAGMRRWGEGPDPSPPWLSLLKERGGKRHLDREVRLFHVQGHAVWMSQESSRHRCRMKTKQCRVFLGFFLGGGSYKVKHIDAVTQTFVQEKGKWTSIKKRPV